MPSTNTSFWQAKFDSNVRRDQRTRHALKEMGWRVIVVWECALKADASAAIASIIEDLTGPINS